MCGFCGDILYWHGKTFFQASRFIEIYCSPYSLTESLARRIITITNKWWIKEKKEHKYFLQTIFSATTKERKKSHAGIDTKTQFPPSSISSHLFYLFSFVKDFINNKRHSASPASNEEMVSFFSIDNEKWQKSQNHMRRKSSRRLVSFGNA